MFVPTAEISVEPAGADAPEIVHDPGRFGGCDPLGSTGWRRVERFLSPEFADRLAEDVLNRLLYERVDYSGLTRLWRGAREVGDAYFGRLRWREEPSNAVAMCDALLVSDWFLHLLSGWAGRRVALMRPASMYRMERGDRICLHDDMSDSAHCLSVVIGLTREWEPGGGGETVFGEVDSVHDLPTPPEIPFQLRRWTLKEGSITIPPAFNTLTVLRLSEGLAHGVNPVACDKVRLSVVALYGWRDRT